jgi:hypothetical protein
VKYPAKVAPVMVEKVGLSSIGPSKTIVYIF